MCKGTFLEKKPEEFSKSLMVQKLFSKKVGAIVFYTPWFYEDCVQKEDPGVFYHPLGR